MICGITLELDGNRPLFGRTTGSGVVITPDISESCRGRSPRAPKAGRLPNSDDGTSSVNPECARLIGLGGDTSFIGEGVREEGI